MSYLTPLTLPHPIADYAAPLDLKMPLTSAPVIRVLLVDALVLVRAGLRALLESKAGIITVGEAGCAIEAIDLAAHEQPDVILIEPNLPDAPGADLIPQLLAAAPQTRVLVVTSNPNARAHCSAIQAGAIGIVLKDQPADVLRKAIVKVHAGEAWLDRATTAHVLGQMTRADATGNQEARKIAALSEREREVIQLIGKGMKNKPIADALSISEVTVRHHLTSIFSKLDINDRLELVIYAYRYNLAELP